MASLGDPVLQLPIRPGHNYDGVTGHDSARLNLGDSYVINQSGFNIHTGAPAAGYLDFTGHYSSAALRPVSSYVARAELQTQMKERLHDTIEQRGRSSKVLVVCGLGGAGKSQLSLSYIETYRDDYTAVFWIDAGAKIRLEADYKQIRNHLHSSKRTEIDLHTCVAEIKQWCHQKQGRWLFVLDSADDIDDPQSSAYIDLRRVVIDTPSADVIITTRSQSAKDMTDLEAVQVAELAPAEARDLFLQRSKLPLPSADVCKEVDAIAEELGFFALAINLAAACIAETPRLRKHPGRYLDEYKLRQKTLLDRKPREHVDQYGASVLTTWETTYAAMADRCPEACRLLTFLAFLGPDNILFELLQAEDERLIRGHSEWLLVGQSSTSVQEALDSGLQALESYSLLSWRDEQSSYSMHKLVHTWSFERLETGLKAQFCETALNFLKYYAQSFAEGPDMQARMVPHIMTCFARARRIYIEGDTDKVSIVHRLKALPAILHNSGRYDLAYELGSFIHNYHKQHNCSDQYGYYENLGLMGNTIVAQGRYKEAIGLLQPALSQCRNACGSNFQPAIRIAHQLGRALCIVKNYTEAEQVLRWALGGCETREDTLITTRFLAQVLRETNRSAEAEVLSWQVLDESKTLYGPTAWKTAVAMTEYAHVLGDLGHYEKLKALLKQALGSFQVTIGPKHPETLVCMADCGAASLRTGNFEEADRLLRQALSGLEDNVGIHEINTLLCVSQLAASSRHQGRYGEALELFQRASDGYFAAFGVDDASFLYCYHNVAGLQSFLETRAALSEALKQVSAQIDKNLQAGQVGQHLRRPSYGRGRALTYPGGSVGIVSRSDICSTQEDGFEDNEYIEYGDERELYTVSDTESNVAEIYGRC